MNAHRMETPQSASWRLAALLLSTAPLLIMVLAGCAAVSPDALPPPPATPTPASLEAAGPAPLPARAVERAPPSGEASRVPAPLPEPYPIRAIEPTPHWDERWPAASPKGDRVACLVRGRGAEGRARIQVLEVRDTGQPQFESLRGVEWDLGAGPPAWVLRGGTEGAPWVLAFTAVLPGKGRRSALFLSEPPGVFPGAYPVRVGPDDFLLRSGRISTPALSGSRIYFEEPEGGAIWSALPDGSERALVGEGSEPQVSPDGRLLVFTSDRGGAPDLWLLRLGGPGAMKPLLRRREAGDRVEGPSWSPRMDRIAFAAGPRSGHLDIFTLEIESGEIEAITRSSADDRDPAFLPDGEGGAAGIIFSSTRANGSYDLFLAEARE